MNYPKLYKADGIKENKETMTNIDCFNAVDSLSHTTDKILLRPSSFKVNTVNPTEYRT